MVFEEDKINMIKKFEKRKAYYEEKVAEHEMIIK